MSKIDNYRKWLSIAALEFGVSEEDILTRKMVQSVSAARHMFYGLCIRDGINLYELSVRMGKHRTAMIKNIKSSHCKINTHSVKMLHEKYK